MNKNPSNQSNAIKEVVLFFSIVLGLSFIVLWGPLVVFQVPAISFVDQKMGPAWAVTLFFIGGFVPSLTAIGLTRFLEGAAGLRSLWKRLFQFRIGGRWYAAMVTLVAFGTLSQILINYALGHSFDWNLFLIQLPSFLPLILIGPLSEEIGWRGYAQDRLQTKFSPLVSGIIVGMFWSLWHLPLFFIPGTSQHELNFSFLSFFFGITSQSVLYAWLHNHTQGSIWTAVFFHWIYTFAGQVVATGITRTDLYNWLEYTPYFLATVVVAWIWSRESKTTHLVSFTPTNL